MRIKDRNHIQITFYQQAANRFLNVYYFLHKSFPFNLQFIYTIMKKLYNQMFTFNTLL